MARTGSPGRSLVYWLQHELGAIPLVPVHNLKIGPPGPGPLGRDVLVSLHVDTWEGQRWADIQPVFWVMAHFMHHGGWILVPWYLVTHYPGYFWEAICLDMINIWISGFWVEQFTLYHVAGPHPASWDLMEQRLTTQREIQPSDSLWPCSNNTSPASSLAVRHIRFWTHQASTIVWASSSSQSLCVCVYTGEHTHTYKVCVLSVVSDSLRPHELEPARLLCPWDSPGKITGVGAISSSRGSSPPRDHAHIPCVPYTGRQTLYHGATWILLVLLLRG